MLINIGYPNTFAKPVPFFAGETTDYGFPNYFSAFQGTYFFQNTPAS